MREIALTLVLMFITPLVAHAESDRFSSCLPDGVMLKSEVVDYLPLVQLNIEAETLKNDSKRKPKTVQSMLIALKAKCKNGTLTDRDGKEIRIVQLIGCWGNPPEDYQEQIDRQRREIEELRKKYIVIEIPCTSSKTIARSMSDML